MKKYKTKLMAFCKSCKFLYFKGWIIKKLLKISVYIIRIKKVIILFFGLSRKEANGFFVLSTLLLFMLLLPEFIRWVGSETNSDFENDKRLLDSLLAYLPEKSEEKGVSKKEAIVFSCKKFNPNTSTELELIESGFPEYLAKRIIKFREKGGRFYKKEDLKKIYGVSESFYEKVEGCIVLEKAVKIYASEKQNVPQPSPRTDINKIDSTGLISFKGIGPKLAGRILKYREALGGFLNAEQLYEVYGLDSQVVKRVIEKTYIAHDFVPRKINLNKIGGKNLERHPYLDKKEVYLIESYRKQHGNFKSPEDLFLIKGLPKEKIEKLFPYLSVDSE